MEDRKKCNRICSANNIVIFSNNIVIFQMDFYMKTYNP